MVGTPGSSIFGKIIRMERFRSGKSLSPLRQAEAYWSALREGGQVPYRSKIDPRGLENILHNTFILERIAPGIARFRLAGQHLYEITGMEVRGMPISALFAGQSRTAFSAALEHVFDAPATAELTLGKALDARMVLLPLRCDLGRVNRALGVIVADGQLPGNIPRFTLEQTRLRPINGLHEGPRVETEMADGFAEVQTPLAGRASHLQLVKSD